MTSKLSLGELATLLRRGITPRYADAGILVLNQKCIRGFRCDWSQGRRHDALTKPVGHHLLVAVGDVLINSTGVGTLGRVAPVRRVPPETTTVDGHVTIVRPDPQLIDPGFFGWAMVAMQPKIERMGEGATGQTELSARRLSAEVTIPTPPRDVQGRIASILDAYEDLIEINRQRIAVLEEMAWRLFEEWFVHLRFPGHEGHAMVETPDGLIPEGWQLSRIGDLTSFLSRGIAPKYDESASSFVINQKCIRDQRLSLREARTQSKAVPKDKLVQVGDILINSTGVGTLGRVAQVEEIPLGITVDSHVTIVRARAQLDRDFFGLALLRMEPTFERLGAGATGQTELNRSRIADQMLTEPPSNLQGEFGLRVRPIRSLAFKLAQQNDILAQSRDVILPRLISGELSVSTAERELEAVA